MGGASHTGNGAKEAFEHTAEYLSYIMSIRRVIRVDVIWCDCEAPWMDQRFWKCRRASENADAVRDCRIRNFQDLPSLQLWEPSKSTMALGPGCTKPRASYKAWCTPVPVLTHDKPPENIIWFHKSEKEQGLQIIGQYIQKPVHSIAQTFKLPLFATTMVRLCWSFNTKPIPRAGVLMQHTWIHGIHGLEHVIKVEWRKCPGELGENLGGTLIHLAV